MPSDNSNKDEHHPRLSMWQMQQRLAELEAQQAESLRKIAELNQQLEELKSRRAD